MGINSNFSKITVGSFFQTSDGERYKKTSALTFDDMAGIEHYIDPFFDKKIGAPPTVARSIDTSARVVKSDETPINTSARVVKPKKVAKKKAAKKGKASK